MAKVIAISTNKGGVLKTSLTTNIAGVLSESYRVLIVDADNQGNAALTFGKNPDHYETTLYNVLVEGLETKKAIHSIYKNIDILPSNDDMAFFEFDVLTNKEKYKNFYVLIKEALEQIKNDYDYILVDCPPNMGLTQANILAAADQVLIPYQPESYSMRSLTKILKAIRSFQGKLNPDLVVMGVVGTKVNSRTVLHSQALQKCRKYCIENNITMYDTVIPLSIRFASSIAFEGLPAVLAEKSNDLVHVYHELTKEIQEKGGL